MGNEHKEFKKAYHALSHEHGVDFKASLEAKGWAHLLTRLLVRLGGIRIRIWTVNKPVPRSKPDNVYFTRP